MAKKEKRYVESRDDALLLAESIADSQEKKTLVKKKRNNERREDLGDKRMKRSSKNDRKLERAKTLVRAQAAQKKRQKAELRKADKSRGSSDGQTQPIRRKGVSFA